jgi:hypothetical protein
VDAPIGALLVAGLLAVAQFVVPLALYAWARSVARRHGNAARWRWARRLPLIALAIVGASYGVPLALFVAWFPRYVATDAATRATWLARAIATSMNVGAVALSGAALLCFVSAALLAYGRMRAPTA